MTAEQLTVLLSDEHEITINEPSCLELTAQQVIELIFQKLNINYDTFNNEETTLPLALWSCGQNLRLQLMPNHNIREIQDKMCNLIKNIHTDGNSMIVFRLARNGFFDPENDTKITDKNILRLLYLEAKTNIQKNIYPRTCLKADFVLNLRMIEGSIDNRGTEENNLETKSCHPNSLDGRKAAKAIKSELLYKNTIKKRQITRSVSLCAERQTIKTQYDQMSLDQLFCEYLAICQTLDCYGGFVFEGQMERSLFESITHRAYYDKKVSIIINKKGVHIVNVQCPKKLETFNLAELEYGIIIPQKDKYYQCLYLKSSNNPKKLFQIFTHHAHFIAKTMKTFMEQEQVQRQ